MIPLTNAVTAYKNLAARGYDDKQIQQTLTSLKDAAAFGRQASYSYGDAIQSATEGLKNENSILVDNAGVTKNVAKMWEDYAKSVGKTTNQLTQQEKITAEVNGILEETKFQVGDAEKYASTFSGKVSKLNQTFYTLKDAIGKVIMPIANLFIPVIQFAMDKLISFFNVIQKVMSAFGLKSESISNSASSSFDNLASSASSAADKASKAAKKINKTMNYDELNILSNNNKDSSASDGTSSSSLGSSPISNISDVKVEDKVSPQIQKIVDKCKKIWNSLWNSKVVKSFGAAVTSILSFYINYWTTMFNNLRNNVSDTWNNIKKNLLLSMSNLSYLWVSYFETTKTTIDTYGPQIIEKMSALFNSIWSGAFDPFIQVVVQTWTDFTSILVELWNEYGQLLAENIGQFIVGLIDTFQRLWDNIMEPIIKPFIEMLSNLWNNHLKDMIKEVAEFVLNLVNSFLELYNKWGKPIIDFLIETLSPIFTNTFQTIWKIVGTIFGYISDAIKNLMKVFNGIIDFITGIFTGNWKKAWEGVRKVFSGVFDGIANVIKTPLNLVITMVEGLINKLIAGFNSLKKVVNKFKIDVPDWVPGIGGKKFGFNLPMSGNISLPRLAQGAWVEPNKPRPVIVGDNKREGEIISPESKIYEQNRKAIRDEMQNYKGSMPEIMEFHFYHHYDDGRVIIEKINKQQILDGKITLLT